MPHRLVRDRPDHPEQILDPVVELTDEQVLAALRLFALADVAQETEEHRLAQLRRVRD